MTVPRNLYSLQCCRLALSGMAVLLVTQLNAFAHTGDPIQHAHSEFAYGFWATLNVEAVLILMAATAVFMGIQRQSSLLGTLPFLFLGFLSGVFISSTAWFPPVLTAYIAAVVIGLLAATSLSTSKWLAWLIAAVSGVFMFNGMFSGFGWEQVPQLSYLGVATAITLGTTIIYAAVWITLRFLPFAWVSIAWRAIASWIVAIAILMIALGYKGAA